MIKFLIDTFQGALSVHLNMFAPEKLQRRISERNFIKTVQNAIKDVKFYNESFRKAGIKPNDIKTLKDIKKLPILTKDDIRANFPDNIVSGKFDVKNCHYSATTGSTGKSLPFIYSLKTFAYYLTTSLRVYTLVGYRPWHKIAYIKYTKIETPNLGPFCKTTHIPSREKVSNQIGILLKSEADVLTGYASIILEIAKNINAEELKKVNLKFVSVNSEMSTKSQRDYISGIFNCPVYDEYSTEETWMIASQCKNHKYHIFSDNVWIEFLDKDGNDVLPGETGEIVITTLKSPAMPFIRYRIGDLGSPGIEKCSCGCNFPVMESFEGRSDDSFNLPDGSYVSSLKLLNTFTMYIKKYLHLMEEFRLIQKTIEEVEVEMVKGKAYKESHAEELLNSLRMVLGSSVKVTMKHVDAIAFKGIKRKAIESLL